MNKKISESKFVGDKNELETVVSASNDQIQN